MKQRMHISSVEPHQGTLISQCLAFAHSCLCWIVSTSEALGNHNQRQACTAASPIATTMATIDTPAFSCAALGTEPNLKNAGFGG